MPGGSSFSTHQGLFEWNVMPFGLCNAPATFARLMEQVLADIVWSQCLVYLDDIIAFGTDFAKAYINLTAVFICLREANLTLKPQKCELFRDRLDYLGHEVSCEGIQPTKSKIAGLHDWLGWTHDSVRGPYFPRIHLVLPKIHQELKQGSCSTHQSFKERL